jgi:hypothetical protein
MKAFCLFGVLTIILCACSPNVPQQTSAPTITAAQLPEITDTPTISPSPVATIITAPSGITIEMTALASPPSAEPLAFSPFQGTQAQVLSKHQELRDQDPFLRLDEANKALQPFGYQIDTNRSTDPTINTTYTITRGGLSLFQQNVVGFQPVSVNSRGTDFLMAIDTADSRYLVSTRGTQKEGAEQVFPPPVFVNNEIVTAEEVYTDTANASTGEVVVNIGSREAFTTSIGSPSPITSLRGLWSDGSNWILEVARATGDGDNYQLVGEIYENGISLNQKFGYQATFEYQRLGGKPFYFYQKNDQIGISYDGQEIQLGYIEIPHYQCCSGGALNPRNYSLMVDFFARKGQAWYFVEAVSK